MSLSNTTRQIQIIVGARPDGVYGPETAGKILAALQLSKPITKPPISTGLDFDNRTTKNLETLQPGALDVMKSFVRRAISIAASMGVELKVICGLRNKADQDKAYANGASKAKWGQSWHNYGMAIDFGCFKGSTYLDSSNPKLASSVYKAIGQVIGEYGIEWGGNWKSFKDEPHFQIDLGRSSPNSTDRKQLENGTWSY